MNPTISILMCTYNGRAFIGEAVADVLSQTFEDWELIVCDDGSADGTREWLRANATDPRIRLFFHERNRGYVANKNFAFAQSRGAFVTQLDQDDRSSPVRLDRMLTAAKKQNVNLVACGYDRIGTDGIHVVGDAVQADKLLDAPFYEPGDYPFWYPSILAAREVFDTVGQWNPYFSGIFGDDLYWTVRAHERFPIYCLADILYSYRDAPASITKTLDRPRKLAAPALLQTLLEQRRATGTDLLERNDMAGLQDLETRILADRGYIARQFRTYAALAIDHGDIRSSWALLWRAWKAAPLQLTLARTIVYALRRSARSSA